ncbi:MAG: amidohydrolase [Clostridioides sp.]|nr:amidohydrolase [Clostridioides sp.]
MAKETELLNVLSRAEAIEDFIVDIRRDIHKNPELSGHEFRTQARIIEELEKMGVEYKKAGLTSVVAFIKGNKPGKTIMLRGDIDALPILEQSGSDYSSVNEGSMHACGHDTHSAMLLGAIKILNDMSDELNGEVRFFFQESEETFEGAQRIIADGFMKGVDMCFGMHNHPMVPTGKIIVKDGYLSAGCDTIFVKFEGVSGHGSTPHLAKDTIHPATVFVQDLQGIVAKNVDSQEAIVVSVGKFVGGTKANIIAKYTSLDISMRYFNKETRKTVHEAIKRHAKAIADMYEIDVTVDIEESALSIVNDVNAAELIREATIEIMGEESLGRLKDYMGSDLLMGSEDFSYYLEETPGAMVWIGSGDDVIKYPPHHEKFQVIEKFMNYGAALHAQVALDFLNK